MFQLAQKADLIEMTKVWDQFQRFAEYKDLKDLHTLVVPEISKFESKLIEYQQKLEGVDQIIRTFDEIIQTKLSKITFREFKQSFEENCVDRNELQIFFETAKKNQDHQKEVDQFHKRMIEELSRSVKKQIEQEVFKQTDDIRLSPFQDPNDNN